jgi:hypothetical protein
MHPNDVDDPALIGRRYVAERTTEGSSSVMEIAPIRSGLASSAFQPYGIDWDGIMGPDHTEKHNLSLGFAAAPSSA